MPQWNLDDMVDLSGKVIIVTGGNGGLGYHSAKMLLEKNAKVYIAARNSQKSIDAVRTLQEETGKEPILLPVDLADLHSVRSAAETFLSMENKLDVLLNNAGIMAQSIDKLTNDGYDGHFGINVLAHFHFTMILLPALLAAPSPRVINLTSSGHQLAPLKRGIYWDKLKGPKDACTKPFLELIERYVYYGMSKLGNILFTNELVRRYGDQGLISIACHPGLTRTPLLGKNHGAFLEGLYDKFAIPLASGVVTPLFAATAPEAVEYNGGYLVPLARPAVASARARDRELAVKMWEYCENELRAF